MASPAPKAERVARRREEASALKTFYLIAYNSTCAVLWATVLGYAIVVPLYKGLPFLGLVANDFTRWTQTIAVLEIFHSIFGIVRAPLLTTLMQVWSRIAIVWGPLYLFPSVAQSPFYTTLLLAWGITEVVRYTYFALLLSTGRVPDFLVWMRYNLFFVLYPIGAGSEAMMCWLAARGPAKGSPWEIAMYLVLILHYPYGFPTLYTHMIKQRRKIMRESAEAKKKRN